MKDFWHDNKEFIAIILICTVVCGFVIYACFGSIVREQKAAKVKWENGWYEAAVISNGIEYVRGQVQHCTQFRYYTKVTINGEEYITSPENVIIIYHPYE